MQVTEFIARLKEECPALKNKVYGAAELAVATPTTMQPPCAFVIPMSEKSEPNHLMGGFSQRVTAQIGVVICVRNFSDTRGEKGHINLEAVRGEVLNALCDWTATIAEIPTEHVSGQLASYDNLILSWNDVFTTQFYYRK